MKKKDRERFNVLFGSSSVTQMIPEGRESSGHVRRLRLVPEIGVNSFFRLEHGGIECSRAARFVSRLVYCETLSRTELNNVKTINNKRNFFAFVRDLALGPFLGIRKFRFKCFKMLFPKNRVTKHALVRALCYSGIQSGANCARIYM